MTAHAFPCAGCGNRLGFRSQAVFRNGRGWTSLCGTCLDVIDALHSPAPMDLHALAGSWSIAQTMRVGAPA